MALEISSNSGNEPFPGASDEPGGERRAARTMETIEIGASGLTASRIALGTWAIGGRNWGGNSDLDESVRTIRSGLERGITLIGPVKEPF